MKKNDVLFVIAGATLGKIAVVCDADLPANTNQAVAFIRPNSRVNPDYLAIWLQSAHVKELTWLKAVQSAQPNLSMSDLGDFVVPIPPLDEQMEILEFTRAELMSIDAAVTRAQREIDLVREYSIRLIADVVTGKLDVREAAGRLPDEAEEREGLEEPDVLAGNGEEAEDVEANAAIEEDAS